MAQGLNRATLIGNLGMDPEIRYTQGGQAVLRLRLATTESYANRAGERQERTEWHTVTVWGNRGEALNKILSKGRSIFVEGRIQHRSWDDKEGNKRNSTEIVATNVILLGGGGRPGMREGGEPMGGSARPQPRDSDFGGGMPADDFGDDDIPF
ncbi:MAG: single-stranded DNA-binding protein [Polyangiales bacterium]